MTIPKIDLDLSSMFQRVSDKKENEATNVCLYGSKSGKSWQIGTCGDRVLWICLDPDGYKTVQSPQFISKFGKVNPIVVEIYEELGREGFGIPSVAQVYDKIYKVLNYAWQNLLSEFDYVAIDSLTGLSRASLLKALDVNAATRKSQTKVTIVEKMNAILPAIQDFGTEMSLVAQLVDHLIINCKKANKTLIVTAHERHMYVKNPSTNMEEYKGIRPAVTGRAQPDNITQAFSNVWYSKRVGTGIFRIYTEGDGEFLASSRNGVPSIVPAPGMEKKYPHGPCLKVMLDDIYSLSQPKGVA